MWGQPRDRRGERFAPYYFPPPPMPTVPPVYGVYRPDLMGLMNELSPTLPLEPTCGDPSAWAIAQRVGLAAPVYAQDRDVLASGGAYGRLPARAGAYSDMPQFVNQPPHARGPDLAPRPRDSDLWDQTLARNRELRGVYLTMTQEDRDGRIWGVDMSACMVPWDILRQDTMSPHLEIIWDVAKKQFRCRLERN